jgi:hypothetical protein
VLSDPGLSELNLPPEVGLLFMPSKPHFPTLRDASGNEVLSQREPAMRVRDIPWLPNPFNVKTEGWRVNLYMVFGATVRDMAARVPDSVEPNRSRTQLENRLLKKSLDYRNRYAGFGQDSRPVKGIRVTDNAKFVLAGNELTNRKAMTNQQLLFVSVAESFVLLCDGADLLSFRELLGWLTWTE